MSLSFRRANSASETRGRRRPKTAESSKLETRIVDDETFFRVGKASLEAAASTDSAAPPPLSAFAKIDDSRPSLLVSGRVGRAAASAEARSLSWPPSLGAVGKHLACKGSVADAGESCRASLEDAHRCGAAEPSSWPCSPPGKPRAVFNEGLGVAVSYAEGQNNMTRVLESIQLCYNPVSKQLQLLPQKQPEKQQQQQNQQQQQQQSQMNSHASQPADESLRTAHNAACDTNFDAAPECFGASELAPPGSSPESDLSRPSEDSDFGILPSNRKGDDEGNEDESGRTVGTDESSPSSSNRKCLEEEEEAEEEEEGSWEKSPSERECDSPAKIEGGGSGRGGGCPRGSEDEVVSEMEKMPGFSRDVAPRSFVSHSVRSLPDSQQQQSPEPQQQQLPKQQLLAPRPSPHSQRHLSQQQQQQPGRTMTDNEASSVSSCFSSVSGESAVFNLAGDAFGNDTENRSDTDSAFQTDDSNFSSLRNSLDQAPLATPSLTPSSTPTMTHAVSPAPPIDIFVAAVPERRDESDARLPPRESSNDAVEASFELTLTSGANKDSCEDGAGPAVSSSSGHTKKTGITGFLSRGFFSRKKPPLQSRHLPQHNSQPDQPKQSPSTQQQQHSGWRLLPRSITSSRAASPLSYTPPTSESDSTPSDSPRSKDEGKEESTVAASAPPLSPAAITIASPKKVLGSLRDSVIGSTSSLTGEEVVPSSTTALILQPRPANLPPKSFEEEQKHRQLYEEMVQEAKKREMKEAKIKRKQVAERLKAEDARVEASKIWLIEILPNWDREKGLRRTRDLWWNGLPSAVRGKVWRLAIGNDLNITGQLYEICALRALKLMAMHEAKRRENREAFHQSLTGGTPRSLAQSQTSIPAAVSSNSSPSHPRNPHPLEANLPADNEAIVDEADVPPVAPSCCPVVAAAVHLQRPSTSASLVTSSSCQNLDESPAGIHVSPSCPSFFLSPPDGSDSPDGSSLSGLSSFASPFDREGTVDLIRLDVSRTFPHLCIFQQGGPYYDILHSLLGAYATYRPDVGYVQGMSFLAAFLLLNMDVAEAFISFANLLNRPCQLAFFRMDEPLMKIYFSTYDEFFKENLPLLWNHFSELTFTPEMYLLEWIFTLYCKALPLDVACRVWDVFLRDGDEFLFRAALGILSLFEDDLLVLDFILLGQFLSKLPESVDPDALFRAVDGIRMVLTPSQRNFSQLISAQKDAILLKAETSSLYSTASGFSGVMTAGLSSGLAGGSMKFSLSSTTSLHLQGDDKKLGND